MAVKNLRLGETITIIGDTRIGILEFKADIIKTPYIDSEGEYGEEGDLICEVIFDITEQVKNVKRYVYHNVELNT